MLKKLISLILLILLFSACMPEIPPTEKPTEEIPIQTEAPVLSGDESYVPIVGKVTFAWEPVEGADSYLLYFTLPTGNLVTFETDGTTKERYMEAFGMSGEFEWNVAALDISGNEISVSIPFNFTKPEAQNQKNDGGSGNSGGEEGPPNHET